MQTLMIGWRAKGERSGIGILGFSEAVMKPTFEERQIKYMFNEFADWERLLNT